MTNPDPVVELLRRVEAATGPHWSLDEDMYVALKQHPTQGPYPRIPAYTASIDAALALVERSASEFKPDIRFYPDSVVATLERYDQMPYADSGFVAPRAIAKTAPLAILAALLKALAA